MKRVFIILGCFIAFLGACVTVGAIGWLLGKYWWLFDAGYLISK